MTDTIVILIPHWMFWLFTVLLFMDAILSLTLIILRARLNSTNKKLDKSRESLLAALADLKTKLKPQ